MEFNKNGSFYRKVSEFSFESFLKRKKELKGLSCHQESSKGNPAVDYHLYENGVALIERCTHNGCQFAEFVLTTDSERFVAKSKEGETLRTSFFNEKKEEFKNRIVDINSTYSELQTIEKLKIEIR